MQFYKRFVPDLEKYKNVRMLPAISDKKTQAVTMIILTLFTLAFFGIFAISPTISTIAELNKQLGDSQFVSDQLDKKIVNLSSLRKQYLLLGNTVSLVFSAVPKNPLPSKILGQLQALADANNLTLSNSQVFQTDLVRVSTSPNVSSFTFAINGSGSSKQVSNFLNDLINFDRLIQVDNISIARGGETNDTVQISIRGKIFYK